MKKMLTLLTVGAILVQSSGIYAMEMKRRMQDARQAMGQGAQQAWQSPRMQRVRTVMQPGERAQVVMNFLTQLASDIQMRGIRTAAQLRNLLMEYKKTTASIIVGTLITAILVALGLEMKSRGEKAYAFPIYESESRVVTEEIAPPIKLEFLKQKN